MNSQPVGRPSRLPWLIVVILLVGFVGYMTWVFVRDDLLVPAARTQVRRVLEDQQSAWNAGDLDGFMAGYRMTEDITFYSGGDVKAGWVGLRERYDKKYRAGGQSMGTLTFSDIEVDLLAWDAAMVRGRWALQLGDRNPSGLFTLLVRKYPEGWRIVHDHTSAAG